MCSSLTRAGFRWSSPSTAFGPKKFAAPGPASGAQCCQKVTVIGEGYGWATCYEPDSLRIRPGGEVFGTGTRRCFSAEASPASTHDSEIGLPLEVGNSYLGSGQISLISPFSEMRSQCIPAHLLPVALSEPSFTPVAHQKLQSTTCRLELCRLLPVRPHTPPTTHLQALAHGHRL